MMQSAEAMSVFAAMTTPAVLLLANAMLILSTNQRLQSILRRVRENELSLREPGGPDDRPDLRRELETHARRAHRAHLALLAFYMSAAILLLMIAALGSDALGLTVAGGLALAAAFGGAGLLLVGTGLLAAETWHGISAIDGRIRRTIRRCGGPDA